MPNTACDHPQSLQFTSACEEERSRPAQIVARLATSGIGEPVVTFDTVDDVPHLIVITGVTADEITLEIRVIVRA
jgi:hypothetical protein